MHILFLGTGPAVAIPRPGHRDPACRDARRGGKSARTRSSALLTVGGKNILIDCSPDFLKQARRARLTRLDAAALTHAHADAAGGLGDLARWLRNRRQTPLPVYAERAVWQRIARNCRVPNKLGLALTKEFIWRPITPGRTFNIFGLQVTPLRVRHSMTPGFPTVGYLFGRSFAYLSDAGALPAEAARRLKGVKTLVLDGALFFGRRMPAHLNEEQAIEMAERLGVGELILTQIGHSYPPHAEAEQVSRAFLRKRKSGLSVRLAYDGMQIKP